MHRQMDYCRFSESSKTDDNQCPLASHTAFHVHIKCPGCQKIALYSEFTLVKVFWDHHYFFLKGTQSEGILSGKCAANISTNWLHVDFLSVYMLVKCFESLEVLCKFPIIITIFFCFKCELLGAWPRWFTLCQWRAENGWLMMNEAHFCHTCHPLELRAQELLSLMGVMVAVDVKNHERGRHASLVHDVTQTAWHQTVVLMATYLWPRNTYL